MKKTILRALVLIALMAPGLSKAQTTCPYPTDACSSCVSLYMPSDYIYCPGFPFSPGVVVPTGFTVTDYAWSPTTDVSPSSGSGNPASVLFTFSNSAPATYTLTVNALGPQSDQ